jgi:aminoglycoside N3'-acetyltransferase
MFDGLVKLGVRPGMALEVHSSLRSLGRVDGGADAVIGALMDAVGADGALVMPSFRLSPNLPLTEDDIRMGLTMKIRILPEDADRTAMGVVADTFRKRPDVVTGEGIFRVSAWGRDADIHARGLHRIIEDGGFALLLGVDIYRLSAMHYVEDALPEEIRARFLPCPEAIAKYPADEWLVEAWAPEAKPWYRIQDEAREKGLIAEGTIGEAKCMLLPVGPVVDLYRQALVTDPFGLYGLKQRV